MATQNPMEYQGTFPLPESQLDRFMMRIRMGYPDTEDEREILRTQSPNGSMESLAPVLSIEEVLHLQTLADGVQVDESLIDYVLRIVKATRDHENLQLGVSPRGGLFLVKAARAMALIQGRGYCIPDDIKAMTMSVLAHRVVVSGRPGDYGQDGDDAERIIRDLVETVPIPL
jgi:MoxR-like ATPase